MIYIESLYLRWALQLGVTYDTWCVVMDIVILFWALKVIAVKGVRVFAIAIGITILNHGLIIFVELARSLKFYELRFALSLTAYILGWIGDIFLLIGLYQILQVLKRQSTRSL
jgi:hypothetical protein